VIATYLLRQLKQLGIPDPSAHSFWQSLPTPATTAYTLGTFEVTIATCTPETEAPSVQTGAPIHSSLGSLLTTGGDNGRQDKQHYESREKALRLVSTTKIYAFPMNPGQFLHWESVTETELLSPPWCLNGVSITRQPTTTPANAPISRPFASYLQSCALQGGEKVS
jgi:hypothetical protein